MTIIIVFVSGLVSFLGCSDALLDRLVTPEMSARQSARYEQQQQQLRQLGTIAIGGSSQYVGMKILINDDYYGTIPEGAALVAYRSFKTRLAPGRYKIEICYGVGRIEGYPEDNYTVVKEYVYNTPRNSDHGIRWRVVQYF